MSASATLHYRAPKTAIARFVAKRTVRGAGFIAIIFGAYVASKSAGFVAAYPSAQGRAVALNALGNNTALVAVLGRIPTVLSVASGAVWNTLPVMAMFGSIWAFLLATKSFRGEEDAGRWELLLSGQTTRRKAAANTLLGLGVTLSVLYLVVALAFILVGMIHTVDYGVQGALFFALAAVSGAVMFTGIGALTSQLMPTRAKASSLAVILFGICFLLRAVGDVTKTNWLTDASPLGWIANLHPLYASSPLWLIPIGAVALLTGGGAIYLAGRRDLGDSVFADQDTAKPHLLLLRGPLTMAIRLTRGSTIGWLLATGFVALIMGSLTKSATKVFDGSAGLTHAFGRISNSSSVGATLYLGIVFFLIMILIMCYAASAAGKMREDEAEGYLDNMLVRPVSRMSWLWGRIMLIAGVLILAGIITSAMVWVSIVGQNDGVSFHTLLLAGINMIVPAFVILGVGIVGLGIAPRLTTVIAYAVIGWSFLMEMIASGIHLNHWILDTSLFNQVNLAPATAPVWKTAWILVAITAALCTAGAAAFNRRDLTGN